jgi:acyl-CoA hydrolase
LEKIMSFKEEYAQKLMSADQAIQAVKSGDWVDLGFNCGTVHDLDIALAKHVTKPERCKDSPWYRNGAARYL